MGAMKDALLAATNDDMGASPIKIDPDEISVEYEINVGPENSMPLSLDEIAFREEFIQRYTTVAKYLGRVPDGKESLEIHTTLWNEQ